MKSPRKTAALLFISILSCPSFTAAQCNETDALLKVTYSINVSDTGGNFFDQAKQLVIRPSGVGDSSLSEIIDYTVEDLVDYEQCVPRTGACLEVAMHNFLMDDYDISWDGQMIAAEDVAVFKGEGDVVIHSTEVGDYCSPICDETSEALFEYDYWSSVGFEDYRVEDMEGNAVLRCDSWEADCQANTYGSLHRTRTCLEKDACYRFLIGDNFQRIPGHSESESNHDIRWNGKVVNKSVSRLFESIKFGETCELDCNPDEESLVEFFMHRVTSRYGCEYNPEPDLTWTLKVLGSEDSNVWSEVSEGVILGCANSSLYHESVCIPKEACASFTVASPVAHELVAATYTLSMDDVIYKRKDFNVDESMSEFTGLNHTTIMGGCDVGTLCDESSQVLVEVDVKSPSEYIVNDTTLAAIPGSFSWDLTRESEATSNEFSLSSSTSFDHHGVDLDSVYRTIECVPIYDACKFQFEFISDFEGGEYTLKRNGVELAGVWGDAKLEGDCDDFESIGGNDNGDGSKGGDSGGTGSDDGGTEIGDGNSGSVSAGSAISRSTYVSVMLLVLPLALYSLQ